MSRTNKNNIDGPGSLTHFINIIHLYHNIVYIVYLCTCYCLGDIDTVTYDSFRMNKNIHKEILKVCRKAWVTFGKVTSVLQPHQYFQHTSSEISDTDY